MDPTQRRQASGPDDTADNPEAKKQLFDLPSTTRNRENPKNPSSEKRKAMYRKGNARRYQARIESGVCVRCGLRQMRQDRRTCGQCYGAHDRASYFRRNYGITLQAYNELVLSQGGRCKICANYPMGKKRLSVDHDHKTGRVRGLLCDKCNMAIGLVDECPERLRGLIRYLE